MSTGTINQDELTELVARGVNLYELLDLKQERVISDREVRRNFRKKALVYHPDKNPNEDARLKFELISKALEVLTSSDLKKSYDRNLKAFEAQRQKNEALSKNLQDLKLNLQRNERLYQESVVNNKRKLRRVDLLKEDGLKRCKLKEVELRQKIKSTNSHHFGDYKLRYSHKQPLLKLKWKKKQNVPDMLAAGVIQQIMEVFGEIEHVYYVDLEAAEKSARYEYCLIKYHDLDGFCKALKHDYSVTSSIWDSMGLRRASSLLRGVELHNERAASNSEAFFEDYFEDVVLRMYNEM